MNKGTIWFDMDGTIANLYSVENWLPKLRAYDPSPYADAAPMLNMCKLAYLLNKLQAAGWRLGIVSWLSKDPDIDYGIAVTRAKKRWLNKHLTSVSWDEIQIIPYGIDKTQFAQNENDILFDDELINRAKWNKIAIAYKPCDIMEVLKQC